MGVDPPESDSFDDHYTDEEISSNDVDFDDSFENIDPKRIVRDANQIQNRSEESSLGDTEREKYREWLRDDAFAEKEQIEFEETCSICGDYYEGDGCTNSSKHNRIKILNESFSSREISSKEILPVEEWIVECSTRDKMCSSCGHDIFHHTNYYTSRDGLESVHTQCLSKNQ
jgi:hypothetical protein